MAQSLASQETTVCGEAVKRPLSFHHKNEHNSTMYLSIILSTFLLTSLGLAAEFDYPLGFEGRDLIEKDLENLCSLNFDKKLDGKEEMEDIIKEMFGIEEVNCTELRRFLEERIQVIHGKLGSENIAVFDRTTRTMSRESNWGGRFAAVMDSLMETYQRRKQGVFGIHTGGNLYMIFHHPLTKLKLYLSRPTILPRYDFYYEYISENGKKRSLQLAKPFPGIIEVGERFFMSSKHPNQQKIDDISNSLFRVAMLVHEARHIKNGKIFNHVACDNLEMERRFPGSCDNSIDGPNGLEGVFLSYTMRICDDCGKTEKMILGMTFLEQLLKINSSFFMKNKIKALSTRMSAGLGI